MHRKFFLTVFLSCFLSVSMQAEFQIAQAGGWYESAFVEWTPYEYATGYTVVVKNLATEKSSTLDNQLIRSYGTYFRADALGLEPGNYQMGVFAEVSCEPESACAIAPIYTDTLRVKAHDRSGFAHFGYPQGVGAYKNDGTLKDGAKVLYIHAGNAKTVEMDITVDKKGTQRHCVGLQHILSAYEKGFADMPLAIRLIGTIEAQHLDSLGSKEEGLQIKGKVGVPMDITVEGVGRDAVIRGFGILARQAESLELRNFAVMTALDDCISLDTKNSHAWVHHIDGFYSRPGSASDQKKGDGTIDVKGNSQYVTIAYNHFFDTGKSTMCGMKQDTSANYITYHHNWFDHSDSRHPRIRRMSVHIYNNYYDGIAKYGVGMTNGGSAFVEGNYFRNCPRPMLISMQGTDTKNGTDEKESPTFSGENGGVIKAYNNVFEGSKTLVYYDADKAPVHFDAYLAKTREEQVPSSVVAKLGGTIYDNFDTDAALMPVITPDAPEDVPRIVTGEGGAGRMQHGDVTFAFTNSDDTSSELNNALANLILNYESSLQAIQGEGKVEPQSISFARQEPDLRFDGRTVYNPLAKPVRLYSLSGICLGSTSATYFSVEYLPGGAYVLVTNEGTLKITKY